MPIYSIDNLIPVLEPGSFVHPSADIIGDVIIGSHCYIGPNAVIRGDFGRIIIKNGSNIQDNCVLHSFPNQDCTVEENGHIGHGAILHGCHIKRNSLIGMNAVIMDGAIIGEECFVGAMSFVKTKFHCPDRSLVLGNPAAIKRSLSQQEVDWKTSGTYEYQLLTKRCLSSLKEVTPLRELQKQRPRFTNSLHKVKS
jgi:phenylacetic acid degradation protein